MRKLHGIGTWFFWLSFTAFAASVAACGDDDEQTETLIGRPCEKSSECDVTGSCVTSGKDGMCVMPCDVPGKAGECPTDTYCDRKEVEVEGGEASAMTLCFPACESTSDCRDGYKCDDVAAGHGKVCTPE